MSGNKPDYMLETLVNVFLLVYDLCTSKNETPSGGYRARQSAGKTSE